MIRYFKTLALQLFENAGTGCENVLARILRVKTYAISYPRSTVVGVLTHLAKICVGRILNSLYLLNKNTYLVQSFLLKNDASMNESIFYLTQMYTDGITLYLFHCAY